MKIVNYSEFRNNAIQETLHLTATKANRKGLEEAITEMNDNKFLRNKLIEK
ncbi:MAG: hypothetical protein KF746_07850 [Chitinophagaceae bacterium]|nr:hypothetical protein [Chitinophagaceae bacterium]